MSTEMVLAIAIVVGLLIASLPVYGRLLMRHAECGHAERGHHGERREGHGPQEGALSHHDEYKEYEVAGAVDAIDLENGYILVSGIEIKVRGVWVRNGETISFKQVLSELDVGQNVKVRYRFCKEQGLLAVEIEVAGGVKYLKR